MKRLAIVALMVSLLGLGGCVIFRPKGKANHSAKGCPPGHVWSDGQCHDKGKGHDPEKHRGKGKKKGKKKGHPVH